MKKLLSILTFSLLAAAAVAQAPQKLSYQAVVRNAEGKLVQNLPVGMRFSILQGNPTGTVVYSETRNALTNVNGLISVEIGSGVATGIFDSINWAQGPFFLKTETDPDGGTSYSVSGTSQLLSVPYALYAEKTSVDGSETKIVAGTNISVFGSGTVANPYLISNGGYPVDNRIILTSSQTWSVPQSVSKIRVELWGASGGGGGAGAYSYSYYPIRGGDGGSGGFARVVMDVVADQQFPVTIGTAGNSGNNAYFNGYSWYGDTNGRDGGDTWFGIMKAAGGTGGKRGSYSFETVHGEAGTDNLGPVTAYAGISNSNILDIWQGIVRSYLGERVLTSKPGAGGLIEGYSLSHQPASGEDGCVVITFFE